MQHRNHPHWLAKLYLLLRECVSYSVTFVLFYVILLDVTAGFAAHELPWSVYLIGPAVYIARLHHTKHQLPWQ